MFEEGLSALRLSGLAVGVVLLLVAAYQLRSYADRRTAPVLLLPLGLGLVLVALFPALANVPADLLSLDAQPYGRLITLLLLSAVLCWLVVIRERHKLVRLTTRFDRLLRSQAVNGLLADGTARARAEPGAVWVVIPVYNEAANLPALLPAIPTELHGHPVHVLVVDDGSGDGSAGCARSHGALVLEMPMNAGGGTGLRAGFDAVLALDGGYVVTLDGDGQHDPAEMSGLLAPLVEGSADIVLGSRLMGQHEPTSLARSLGIYVFNAVISVLTGRRITDCASGYRAFRTAALKPLTLVQEQYHTAELIIEAAKHGCRIAERPITIRRRRSGHSKKGGNLFYGLSFLRTILKTWVR